MPTCSECKYFCPNIKVLVIHLTVSHRVCLKFKCGETGCLSHFNCLKTFKSHLRRVHYFSNQDAGVPSLPLIVEAKTLSENDEDSNVNSDCQPQLEIGNTSAADFKAAVKVQSECFVAKLYSKNNLPRNHVQHFIDDSDIFLGGGFMNILREKCLRSLTDCKADVSVIDEIETMFNIIQDPFAELKTEYMRLKRFKESSDYIGPMKYKLGKEFVLKNVGCVKKPVWSDVHGQHFPLKPMLKKFLELPNCLNDILSYVESLKSENDTISNFMQGELWLAKRAKFQDKDIVFPLIGFFHDLECNNALGPHSGKIGAFYVAISCLPPECQSALKNIFIALLFNSVDRVEFGNGAVLKPLLEEFKSLESEGILVEASQQEVTRVYFVLGVLTCDNLGIHQIGGFVESFKANYPCRFCKASKEQVAVMERVDESLLRNIENYNRDLLIDDDDVSQIGINTECEFNKIPSFHITKNYAVDCMHDVAEGVCKYVMGFIVSDCISKNYLTLHSLNNRMRQFDYGTSNRPAPISQDHLKQGKVKMTAAECFCFVRFFGVLVGDLVPNDNLSWRLYLSLMRVIDVILAKTVPKSTFLTFPDLVQELLCGYKKLSQTQLKPKFHFLLHYAMSFKMCGPVSNISCMRFEGKHRKIKPTPNMSRVNLTYSIGVKHQLEMCSLFKSKESILLCLEVGSALEICLSDHDMYSDFRPNLPKCFRDHGVRLGTQPYSMP